MQENNQQQPDSILVKLSKISSHLSKIPSLLIVIIYILSIFLFAAIYYSLDKFSFYHSTSQYELEFFEQDAQELINILETEIRDSLNSIEREDMTIGAMQINNLDLIDFPEHISFTVNLPILIMIDNQQYIPWELISKLTLPTRQSNYGIPTIPISENTMYPVQIETLVQLPEIDNIEALIFDDFLPSNPALETPILLLDTEIYRSLRDYGWGYVGFPKKVRGHVVRMLYLSAGIAFASSPGDIVPVTTLARTLVLTQSFFSIIMLTLFLNSLADDIANRQP